MLSLSSTIFVFLATQTSTTGEMKFVSMDVPVSLEVKTRKWTQKDGKISVRSKTVDGENLRFLAVGERKAWGNDAKLANPGKRTVSLRIVAAGRSLPIPPEFYVDCYNLHLERASIQVDASKIRKIIWIKFRGGGVAGAYHVAFLFVDGKFKGRTFTVKGTPVADPTPP